MVCAACPSHHLATMVANDRASYRRIRSPPVGIVASPPPTPRDRRQMPEMFAHRWLRRRLHDNDPTLTVFAHYSPAPGCADCCLFPHFLAVNDTVIIEDFGDLSLPATVVSFVDRRQPLFSCHKGQFSADVQFCVRTLQAPILRAVELFCIYQSHRIILALICFEPIAKIFSHIGVHIHMLRVWKDFATTSGRDITDSSNFSIINLASP